VYKLSQTVSIMLRTMCYGIVICKFENDVEQFLYLIIQAYPAQNICSIVEIVIARIQF
jgi:hypothetical protein